MASRRSFKICLGVFALFLVIVAAVIVTLIFTVFKIKNPNVSVNPEGLEDFEITFLPNLTVKVNLSMVITMKNPNYGSFEYRNSTSYVNFHNTTIARVPMASKLVPARSTITVRSSADFMADRLIRDSHIWDDISAGMLNFTSRATLPGKIIVLKVFRLDAAAHSNCTISLNVTSRDVESKCLTIIKL